MEMKEAAKKLNELGNVTRLSIFRLLVKSGPEGLPVGAIQKVLQIPGSTLSHHINRLVQVGLVNQRRESRILYCEPRMEELRTVIDFLLSECCSGVTVDSAVIQKTIA